MQIEIGDFAGAIKEDDDSKVPLTGTFELQIKELPLEGEEVLTKDKDPKMVFKLSVVNSSNPVFQNRVINYHAKIPSIFFTRILRAAGVSWTASQLDTAEIASSMYNKILKATVQQKDADSFPNIKSFIY